MEVFQFWNKRFNIDKAVELAKTNQVYYLDREQLETLGKYIGLIFVDQEYAKTVDLSKPVIIGRVKIGKETFSIPLDGWHRIQRALNDNVSTLKAVLLDEKQTKKCEL